MVTITRFDFLKVLATTALVFLVGLGLGFSLDTGRINYLAEELRSTNLETESFVTTQQYLEDATGDDYCRLADGQITRMSQETAELGTDLQEFGGAGMFREGDYEFLQRRYYVYQTRFMLLLEDYRERCDQDFLSLLYFFGDNVGSQRQGSVLTEFRQENQGEVFVFSFALNAEDSPLVDLIAADHNVTSTPTVIVNQNTTLRGFTSKGELEAMLQDEVNMSAR